MPFGVSSAPENIQKQISEILQDQEGTLCHMKDMLVFRNDEDQHEKRLKEVFFRLTHSGLTLSKEKCHLKTLSVDFLGHTVMSEGISASTDKIKAVLEMKTPTNTTELKRVLGMVDYMRKFNLQLAEVESPMRELLKKKNL